MRKSSREKEKEWFLNRSLISERNFANTLKYLDCNEEVGLKLVVPAGIR